MKQVHRKSQRTPKETAKLRADRKRYQRDKPSPEQLLAEGGHQQFIPLGELMFIHQVMASLKKERERQGLTLADLSKRCGIDQAALSKLESGSNGNPTLQSNCVCASRLANELLRQPTPGPRSIRLRICCSYPSSSCVSVNSS